MCRQILSPQIVLVARGGGSRSDRSFRPSTTRRGRTHDHGIPVGHFVIGASYTVDTASLGFFYIRASSINRLQTQGRWSRRDGVMRLRVACGYLHKDPVFQPTARAKLIARSSALIICYSTHTDAKTLICLMSDGKHSSSAQCGIPRTHDSFTRRSQLRPHTTFASSMHMIGTTGDHRNEARRAAERVIQTQKCQAAPVDDPDAR